MVTATEQTTRIADKDRYGILAQFNTPAELVEAARKSREAGYIWSEAYSPYPVHGLVEAMGYRHTTLPWLVFLGGLTGCIGGYLLQYWVSVLEYPLNIGGRPLHSWPSFIPVTFECTILLAALSAVLGMLALNGLPRPHHPLFAVEEFSRASRDHFFFCIQARDKQFEYDKTMAFLESLNPVRVFDVPN